MKKRIPLFLVLMIFVSVTYGTEQAQPDKENRKKNIDSFITEISNRLEIDFSEKNVEELYQWGEGICTQLSEGRTEQQLIEGNMDQFFGPKLGPAIVEAAHKVICPKGE